jgi:transcriptional regulator with XRE-family HTH domain
MGLHNIHNDHPLQFIRTKLGLKQQPFADMLGIPVSTLSKREAFIKGYEVMPDELHRQLRRVFGAYVIADFNKPPGPGYYLTPTGTGGVPYTKEYAEEYMRERFRLVKHTPADVIEALKAVSRVAVTFQREAQFADGLALGVKALCASPRFRNAVGQEIKKLIREKKFAAADWLCNIIEHDKLRQQIPVLPSELAHQLRVVKKVQKVAKRRGHVVANGNKIALSKRIKKSDLLPPPLSAAPHPSGKKKAR